MFIFRNHIPFLAWRTVENSDTWCNRWMQSNDKLRTM